MRAAERVEEARRCIERAHRVAVLTGAGISAASGIPTFRGPGGLWEGVRPEELATPEAYARDPQRVWSWYAWRYRLAYQARPNRAHELLVQLERDKGDGFLLVTQNVDGLHARAGSQRLVELHGSLHRARCEACQHRFPLPPPETFMPPPRCPRCGSRARPDVVWFGELVPGRAYQRAAEAFRTAEVALVVGTSAVVEPAASLGRLARLGGAYLVEVNPEQTPLTPLAHLSLRCGAEEGLEPLIGPRAPGTA
ncbi:MAG: NAD-dependent deacylase [Armatimonadota bacterium]|nr:NAD-dependent deacylase [Armatimonadota bacterium]MDR5676085.1 NAD-dependent deacylase [Armatimonadota bacterium]MDR5689310.1 NAD-dependent deacylase [Armatimonadota bacterium]MDR7387245.1 NAD-dependent deacylase [Armatimonadota bacterium]MDR7389830.1 NAD-dependent deacylase [Armatimonadota bacterium]